MAALAPFHWEGAARDVGRKGHFIFVTQEELEGLAGRFSVTQSVSPATLNPMTYWEAGLGAGGGCLHGSGMRGNASSS